MLCARKWLQDRGIELVVMDLPPGLDARWYPAFRQLVVSDSLDPRGWQRVLGAIEERTRPAPRSREASVVADTILGALR